MADLGNFVGHLVTAYKAEFIDSVTEALANGGQINLDNLQWTREQYFSFVVKTDFTQSHRRFDQCGIVMYLDSDNWLKGSVEFENEEFQHLGSVATNNGWSDWAALPQAAGTAWRRRRKSTWTHTPAPPPSAAVN